jgi:hypothetical protein
MYVYKFREFVKILNNEYEEMEKAQRNLVKKQ